MTLGRVLRRWDALLLVFGLRVVLSMVLTLPLLGAGLSTGIFRHPDADALMFAPGGMLLTEAVRLSLDGVGALAKLTFLGLVLAMFVSLLGVVVLLTTLGDPDLSLGNAIGRGLARLPTCYALFGGSMLTQILILAAASTLAAHLQSELALSWREPQAALAAVALLLLGVLATYAVGIVRDLAFASACSAPRSAWEALREALGLVLARPGRIVLDYASIATWQLVAVLAVAWTVTRLPVASGSSGVALAVLALEVCALALITLLQALWRGRSLTRVLRDRV
ncbi:MAG: hypothetical protein R3B13_28885 [Polyangiaceae bacterium]